MSDKRFVREITCGGVFQVLSIAWWQDIQSFTAFRDDTYMLKIMGRPWTIPCGFTCAMSMLVKPCTCEGGHAEDYAAARAFCEGCLAETPAAEEPATGVG